MQGHAMVSLAAFLATLCLAAGSFPPPPTTLFIGTLNNASILSIVLTGSLLHGDASVAALPLAMKRSWQALHPSLPVLYSADGGAGQLSAWDVLPGASPSASQTLSAAGAAVDVGGVGTNPVLVAVARTPRSPATPVVLVAVARTPRPVVVAPATPVVIAADYSSGAVAAVRTDLATGRLVGPAAIVYHSGHTACPHPVKGRQDSPHPHGAFPLPSDPSHVYVPDLGLDMIFHYRVAANGSLVEAVSRAGRYTALPCSGPRHLSFSANERFLVSVERFGREREVKRRESEILHWATTIPTWYLDLTTPHS